MQLIKVSELKPHPQNNYFFDDITGDKWKDILESISRRGVIEPVVITQDKVIVSGHQRVRACNELKINEVLCEIRIYQDDDKHSKEDKILEDLISTNIMQRGIGNTNPLKLARCIQELERIKGVREGSFNKRVDNRNRDGQFVSHGTSQITQEDIAKQFGVSVKKVQRIKSLLELPEDIQRLIETGVLDNVSLAKRISEGLNEEQLEDFIQFLTDNGFIKVTSQIFEKFRNSLQKSKQQEIAHMQNEITNLKNDIGSLEKERINLNNQIKTAKESGRQEEIKRLQPKLDKANRDIEEKEELIKKLNKYNLTEKEIDTANIKFEQSSQSITLAVEVEYNVQKIISEISKLKISDLYNNSDEVVYRDSVLKIVYLAQNELNKIINELSPNEKVSTYNNQDIIEGVYYHE